MLRENVPKSIRHDLGRHGKTGRHIRKHLEEHLKKVGQKAEEFLDKNKILHLDGLVLCSHSELFFDIKKNLPVFLRKKIIGEVILTPDVSLSKATSEIIKKLDL